MFAFFWFGVPLLLGALSGATLARGFWRTYAVLGLGLLLAFGYVVAAYLLAPSDYQHSSGTEGEQFLGRWWDPTFDLVLAMLGYLCWLGGVGVGALVRAVITAKLRHART